MSKIFHYLFFFAALTSALQTSRACDLCGCYTPQAEAMPSTDESASGLPSSIAAAHNAWLSRAYFAAAEQFTYFNTAQFDGREVANPTDQYLASFVTQFVGGYFFTPRFALQVNVPLIYRSFQRPEGFAIDQGAESGLGDVSLLGKFVLFHKESGGNRAVNFEDAKNPRMELHEPDFHASASLIGGVKFPTGSTNRLKEEFHEIQLPAAPQSGIHGHDLTLGTGSYDGIIGGQASISYRSLFLQADTQFTLRGDGLHQYHFANDLSWSAGPGYYFIRHPNAIVGVQCVTSGEYKDVDRFRGKSAEDTGITSVLVGPRLLASVGKLSGELALDLPVSINNTAFQIVPDYRIRASLAVRF